MWTKRVSGCLTVAGGSMRFRCRSARTLALLGIRYVVVHPITPAVGITNWMEKYHGARAGQYIFSNIGRHAASTELYVVRLN